MPRTIVRDAGITTKYFVDQPHLLLNMIHNSTGCFFGAHAMSAFSGTDALCACSAHSAPFQPDISEVLALMLRYDDLRLKAFRFQPFL